MTKDVTVIADEIKALEAIAKYAASSKHFEKLGGEAGIFCIAMYAKELGLPIMTCLFGGMKPVLGNIEISPRMMNAMVRKAGHKIEILESTGDRCILKGTRHDTKESYTCSFTLDDARRAGLVRGGGGYEKWASDMLFARCLSRLSRRLFADVISTAYIEGEISSPLSDAGQLAEESIETVIEAVNTVEPPSTPVSMNVSDFVNTINIQLSAACDVESMIQYLGVIEKERKVSVDKIMAQALKPEWMQKFYNGFKTWQDAKADAEEQNKA